MTSRHFGQVLAELELCSMSRAANLTPSGGGKPGSVILTLVEKPPADYWRERWEFARDEREQEDVRKSAEAELRSIRVGPGLVEVKPETKEERAARIMHRKNTGWSANDVALSERVPVREVLDARTDAGVDPGTGKPWPEDEARDEKIRRLKSAGMSSRQIAVATRASRRDVDRVIREAA